MARETYQAGVAFKQGDEVWLLEDLSPLVWQRPLVKHKGDEMIGTAAEDAEAYGLLVVEVK